MGSWRRITHDGAALFAIAVALVLGGPLAEGFHVVIAHGGPSAGLHAHAQPCAQVHHACRAQRGDKSARKPTLSRAGLLFFEDDCATCTLLAAAVDSALAADSPSLTDSTVGTQGTTGPVIRRAASTPAHRHGRAPPFGA